MFAASGHLVKPDTILPDSRPSAWRRWAWPIVYAIAAIVLFLLLLRYSSAMTNSARIISGHWA